MPRYKIEGNEYGPILVLQGRWHASIEKAIKERNISQLELCYCNGWRGSDLEFLRSVPHLRALRVSDTSLLSVSGLRFLTNLNRLMLDIGTVPHGEVPFQALKALESCILEWNPAFSQILDCKWLRRLDIRTMRGVRSLDLARLTSLEELLLTRAPGLIKMCLPSSAKLAKLLLRQLHSLRTVDSWARPSRLRHLWLTECKRLDLAHLVEAKFLREVVLMNMGQVKTLTFLKEPRELERLQLIGSTTIEDGDLACIAEWESIKSVSFPPRVHYNITLDALQAMIHRPGAPAFPSGWSL